MKCIKTVKMIGLLTLLMFFSAMKSSPDVQAYDKSDEIPIASQALPEHIARYIGSRGWIIPTSLSKYCGFDFKKGGNPFIFEGDFDGDGKVDYAVNVEVGKNRGKILIFLANGQIYEIADGWDFIMANKTRGTIQTMEGRVNLQYDSIYGIRCESSAALYVYNKAANRFDKFFTSD